MPRLSKTIIRLSFVGTVYKEGALITQIHFIVMMDSQKKLTRSGFAK